MQKCGKPTDLKGLERAFEDTNKMAYWDEISLEIDEICLAIANCQNRCENEVCKNLQNSDAIQLAFDEEMADRCIIDTLPDDEFF